MIIQGLQKLTLLDYPGKLAATVFLGGCNFRCPFCHNASLVLSGGELNMGEEELFAFLESRRTKLQGVCISGGEPTLYDSLPSFIYRIKEMGFSVKLDTNGTNPEMIYALLADGLIDYVAMDIKNSKARYAETVGLPSFDISAVEESVAFLLSGSVDYEFRTTVVRELHNKEDMQDIGEWIAGAKRYFLQTFKDSGDLIGEGLSAYTKEEMQELLAIVKPHVGEAALRG